MKKVFMILMTAVLFAGCAKNADNVETSPLKVVFSVSEKSGFDSDTKAIKTGWSEGDQILLVFRPHDQTKLLPFAENTNTIKITYADGEWSATDFNGNEASLSTEGYYAGIYHYGDVAFDAVDGNNKVFLKNYTGGDFLECFSSYTISDGVLDLGEINMKRDEHLYMISVRNLASVEGPWTLYVGDNNNMTIMLYDIGYAANCLFMYSDDSTGGLRNFASYGEAGGSVNGTDISFLFKENGDYKGERYYFRITNGVDTYELVKEGVDANTLREGNAYYLPDITSPRWTKK